MYIKNSLTWAKIGFRLTKIVETSDFHKSFGNIGKE